ncbi:hypothetical protein C8J57DRAFT_1513088 [Mycena rebaudengoi]|nr:hypothetical protein C8J57DRAFT_1513088 [Mycena rebaudengoi]
MVTASTAIFDHPPFNSTVFRDFARKSSAIITKAEKDVALALEKLPEHIANTFHAAMARLAIDQQIEREATKTFQEEMLALLQGSGGAGGTKKRRKVAQETLPPPQMLPPPSIPGETMYPKNKTNPPGLELLDHCLNIAEVSPTIPKAQLLSPFVPTLAPFPPSSTRIPSVPAAHFLSPSAPTSTGSMITTPTSTPHLVLPPAGVCLTPSEVQVAAWKAMAEKYGEGRLRRHQGEWINSGVKANTYRPYYQYQDLAKISDVWSEWVTGLNGHLSTRELEEGRRKKAVNLITQLAAKRNWTVDLALRFIHDRYELARKPNNQLRFPTVRSFFDYLQKKPDNGALAAVDEILFQSDSYTV